MGIGARLIRAGIAKEAGRLVRVHETRNPYKIAAKKGITVTEADLGDFKGMYYKTLRRKFIFINENLDELFRHIVCAHELAHAIKHNNINWRYMDSFFTYSERMDLETEANIFAASMVIRLDGSYDCFDLSGEGMDERLYQYFLTLKKEYVYQANG
jgi:Zn-dependent peptidase ImmA (M78 family)